ncbi:MAG: hypothetical protein M1828_003651 [Chrysothrix sp. TS-e1954]|nr:MAG: hypothetical protein M1828_003651 [Chrysothrix sp. TS-e1954]
MSLSHDWRERGVNSDHHTTMELWRTHSLDRDPRVIDPMSGFRHEELPNLSTMQHLCRFLKLHAVKMENDYGEGAIFSGKDLLDVEKRAALWQVYLRCVYASRPSRREASSEPLALGIRGLRASSNDAKAKSRWDGGLGQRRGRRLH